MTRVRPSLAALLGLALFAGACSSGGEAPEGPRGALSPTAVEPPPSASERLGLDTGWGPSRQQLDRAARQVRAMPLPDLAGQVVVARWTGGTRPPTRLVRDLHLGGVVVFDENVVTAGTLRRTLSGLEAAAGRPLLVAVDQEGGLVQRLRAGCATPASSPSSSTSRATAR